MSISACTAPKPALDLDQFYALALAACALIGALLRLHRLGALPLNFDEGATLYFAGLPFADLWGSPAILETNPPLFYSIERCITLLCGHSEWVLRLPSVIAGTLSILVVARIARSAGGRATGLAAAALLATSAVSIASSQDARTYAILTLAALLAVDAQMSLLHAYRTQGQRAAAHVGPWAIYILCCIALLYLHNTAVILIAAFNLVALAVWAGPLQTSRHFILHWAVANMAVLAAYLPWLPIVTQQFAHALSHFWLAVPTVNDLRYAMENLYAQPYIRVFQPAVDLLFVGAGIAGIALRPRRPGLQALAVFVLLGVPLMSWVISQWRPIMNGKTFLPLAPLFLVFVSLGCMRLRRVARAAALSAVALQLIACDGYFSARYDEGYPQVAAALNAQARQGDSIFLDPPSSEGLLAYYHWPRGRLSLLGPPGTDPWFRAFDGDRAVQAGFGGLTGTSGRLWVLTRSHPDEQHAIAGRLLSQKKEVLDQVFGQGFVRNTAAHNLELSLFVPRG